MALKANMELQSGVVVDYHRIASLNIITNVQNMIEVSSYTSETKRNEEKDALENGELSDVFVLTIIVSAPYDQDATIESTYEYLKTLPLFKDAEDI